MLQDCVIHVLEKIMKCNICGWKDEDDMEFVIDEATKNKPVCRDCWENNIE